MEHTCPCVGLFISRQPLFHVREKIRTPDTLVRSQVLYPAELHTHIVNIRLNVLYLTPVSGICQ